MEDIAAKDNTGFVNEDGSIDNQELYMQLFGKGDAEVEISIEDKFDMLMKAKSVGIPEAEAKKMFK